MNRVLTLYLSCFCLLVLQTGDLHSHFCLDGQEPAVTLHYENLQGHPDHDADGADDLGHDDVEFEINTATLLAKAKQAGDLHLLPDNTTLFSVLPAPVIQPITQVVDLLPATPSVTLPPLRAPPVLA